MPSARETTRDVDAKRVSLRQEQLAVTRHRIITALGELIESQHPLDITMSAVAKQAGVSEPTVYRHFATKRDLFAALGSDLYEKTTTGFVPTSVDDLIRFVPDLYAQLAGMEATIRWNLASQKDEVVRPPAAERIPILRDALAENLDDMPAKDSDALMRALLVLTSPTCLLYWQDYLGLSVEESAETASWMIRRLAQH